MSADYIGHIHELRDFGIFSTPLRELAKLIALELFYQGKIDAPGFSNEWNQDVSNPRFQKALSGHADKYESALIESIERNEIKAEWLRRNIENGSIDPENTLLHTEQFQKFLDIFGLHDVGIESDMPVRELIDSEGSLFSHIIDYIVALRAPDESIDNDWLEEEKAKYGEQPELLESLLMENFRLREEAASRSKVDQQEEKPIATRERNTLLAIIAALAKEAGVDLSRPAKAGELIAKLTEQIGARVDHYTVEQKIKQIQDAIESRSK